MTFKQISKANNEGLDPVNTTTKFSHLSTITETLRKEDIIASNFEHEGTVEEKFEYLKSHIPMLREFKYPIRIFAAGDHLIMWDYEVIYGIPNGTLFINPEFVKLLYGVYKLGGSYSRGVEAIFAHELFHERIDESMTHLLLPCNPLRKIGLRDFLRFRWSGWIKMKDAAAQLCAIGDEGLEGLVNITAIIQIAELHKRSKLPNNNQGDDADLAKILKRTCLDHWAVDRWHDEEFMRIASKLYPPAKEIASRIPTDYGTLTNLILQRVKEITEALNGIEKPMNR